MFSFFFFFNDTATTEIYTLSLHDALPIYLPVFRRQDYGSSRCRSDRAQILSRGLAPGESGEKIMLRLDLRERDRKSTRLNSSHQIISYAVFCLKKKKIKSDNVHATETSDT